MQVMGHETAIAYDGLAAVSVAEMFRPEVVLLDLGLPGLDGCDAARLSRADGRPWSTGQGVATGFLRARTLCRS